MREGKAGGGGEESNNESREHPDKSKSRSSRWDKQQPQSKQEAQPGPVASAPDMDPATAGAQNAVAGSPMEPKATPAADSQKSNPGPLDPTEAGPLRDPVDAGFPKNPRLENAAPKPVQLGFEILERRSITMMDGTVRTYYSLPQSEQQEPFPSGNAAVSSFENAKFGSRELSPRHHHSHKNQYAVPENSHAHVGPLDARKAENERFYGASPMAPPLQSSGSGYENYGSSVYENSREGPGDESSIPRAPRDYQYGNVAGMGPFSSSVEVPSERDYVPAGGPGLDGSAREGYPYRNLGHEGGGPVEGSRNPMSPHGYQVSPRSAAMRMAPREPFYGSGDNLLKRKYAEEEAASGSMPRGVMDNRDYMRRAREMEIEEFRRREQGTSDFSREKYLEEEIMRSGGYSMSRPSHYDSPHGVPASRFTSKNKDIMRGPSAESWVSPSHPGPGGSLNQGRQDLQYNNALGRDRDDGHDYQRPFKHQKQNDFHDSQNRARNERHAVDDALKFDREPVQQPGLVEDNQELKQQVHRAYLRFVKSLNENAGQRRRYQEDGKGGPVQCVVCSSQSKDFTDTHSLVMHAYNAPNPVLRSEHLGLYKALCVLMGWSYASPPDNEKSYQSFPAPEAMENNQDLILWPPLVIIQNACSGKKKDGRFVGIGNREMDEQLAELGFTGGKSKAVYGRDGHQGTIMVKFSPSSAGLQEAEQLIKYFERNNHGRKDWLRVQSSTVNQENSDENPDLVETDEKTKLQKRVLYGYIAIAGDLEKLDADTRKKAIVKSKKDIDATADGLV